MTSNNEQAASSTQAVEESARAWMAATAESLGVARRDDGLLTLARALTVWIDDARRTASSTTPVSTQPGRAILLALATQFDGMADAAYADHEYDRRDVWRNAASQARARAKQDDWIADAQGERP